MENRAYNSEQGSQSEYFIADVNGTQIEVRYVDDPEYGRVMEDHEGMYYMPNSDQPSQTPITHDIPGVSWEMKIVGQGHPGQVFGGADNVIPMPLFNQAPVQPIQQPGISPFQHQVLQDKLDLIIRRGNMGQQYPETAPYDEQTASTIAYESHSYGQEPEFEQEERKYEAPRSHRRHPNAKYVVGLLAFGLAMGYVGHNSFEASKETGQECQLNPFCVPSHYVENQIHALFHPNSQGSQG